MTRLFTVWAMLAVATVSVSGVVWGQPDSAADATRPENDRVRQLERRIAVLEERLARIEQRQGVQPAVQYVTPIPPQYFTTPATPIPGTPPAPLPEPSSEINGVKFRLYLLGDEYEKPKPRESHYYQFTR